jgi:hydroxymethylbilane synthase
MDTAAKSTLTIGTRGSQMALAQTGAIRDALCAAHPGLEVGIVQRETRGDRDAVSQLGQHGGKGGAFVHELRALMKAGKVDMLMHCLKDLPGNEEYYETENEFRIGAFLPRDDPRDALVVATTRNTDEVLADGVIGTNAVRRRAYIRHRYRGVQVVHFRGKVDSRLHNLDTAGIQKLPYGGSAGPVDALVLAKSGLERINLGHRISKVFSIDEMCPAVGQGVVVVEFLAANERVAAYLSKINHKPTEQCCLAERAMLRVLNGHCNSPIAGYAWISDGRLCLRGVVISVDGRHVIEVEDSTELTGPEDLGDRVGKKLNERGAKYIIDECRYVE